MDQGVFLGGAGRVGDPAFWVCEAPPRRLYTTELDACAEGEGRAAPQLRAVRFHLHFPAPSCLCVLPEASGCPAASCSVLRAAGARLAQAGAAGAASLIPPFIPASVNTLPCALGPLRAKLHRSRSAGAGAALTPLVS